MNDAKLSALVAEAVETDRQFSVLKDRLAELKAELVREAESRNEEHTETELGGSTWSATGTDGCIARVTFGAPSLKSKIDGEGKTIERVRAAAGRAFDRLFVQAPGYRPVADFRAQAELLLGKDGRKLIRLCETDTAPRVHFETKEAAA